MDKADQAPSSETAVAEDAAPFSRFSSPEEEAAFLAAVDEGIADADAGRVIPYEKVRAWLESWGTDNELPPPECE